MKIFAKRLKLFVFAWMLTSVLVGIIWGISEYKRLQEEFDQSARVVYSVVSRKLDQNESVLSAIDALLMSRKTFDLPTLRSFSHEILSHYPQLYTAEFFQSVTAENRESFVTRMREQFGSAFFIRDYDIAGRRNWLPAPIRPQSLVITMIEPDIPSAGSVYGFDVLAEPLFKHELQQAIVTGQKVSSQSFDLYEGGRVYMLMKPFYHDETGKPLKGPANNVHLTGVVALVVYCEKLLSVDVADGVPGDLDLSIRSKNDVANLRPFYTRPHKLIGHSWLPSLSQFNVQLPFSSDAQPFVLGVAKDVRFDDVRFGSFLLRELFILFFFIAGWLLYAQRMALMNVQSQADETIFLQSERAAVTLNAIHDGVITLGPDQRIEIANPMALALIGLPAEEVIGVAYLKVFRLLNELAASLGEDPIAECFRTRVSVEFPEKMQLVSGKGNVRSVEGAVAPLFSRSGQLTGVVCALRDMGPVRLRAAEALAASELRVKEHLEKLSHVARLHTMGEMASGIAHEVNQPLAAISNYCQASLQFLEMGDDAIPQAEVALKLAVAQANRAGEIIKRLRALVSKRAVEVRLIDLNQVVGNCMFLAEYDLKERGIEVIQLLAVHPIAVWADSIQMEQVVLNLLSNAMDALKDEPAMKRHIIIHTRKEGAKGILEVRDSGRGITPEALEVLFHPFFSTKPHGMGLGLSICQSIVEQYGGLISAENIQASGACFKIELPLSNTSMPSSAEVL